LQQADGSWGTETERLLLMDSRDFNRVGVGVDDLIEAYMQVIQQPIELHALVGKIGTTKHRHKLVSNIDQLVVDFRTLKVKPPSVFCLLQTVLAVTAIDGLACKLITPKVLAQ